MMSGRGAPHTAIDDFYTSRGQQSEPGCLDRFQQRICAVEVDTASFFKICLRFANTTAVKRKNRVPSGRSNFFCGARAEGSDMRIVRSNFRSVR
jgi:hypothetical protein